MPTIIDSLFLELGIDTAKFGKDEQKALVKIKQFESQAKRSAGKAADSIKTVGQAFRDLSKDSSVGASAAHLDTFAQKLKTLGQSAQVAGGAATPFGVMAEGLGMLLSPAALGVAAVGLLGKGMWDLNKNMTATNATMYRQAQLSGMNAANLWDWGEAARTVGGNPADVTGGISSLQTSIAGMMIGAGNAAPQLVALARLGVGWNAESGMTDEQVAKLFEVVHQKAKEKGYKNLGALRALTGPVMNDTMFNIATNPTYDPSQLQKEIQGKEAPDTGAILKKSLESQTALGKFGIEKDVLAEIAYGGEQGVMQAVLTVLTSGLGFISTALTSILGVVNKIADFFVNPKKAYDDTVDRMSGASDDIATGSRETAKSVWAAIKDFAADVGGRLKDLVMPPAIRGAMSHGMQTLMDSGVPEDDAASMIGNMAQESTMNPLAANAGHRGLMQWDKARQTDFAKQFGYAMGSSAVSADKQFQDQLLFAQAELRTTQQKAAAKMAKARDLLGKTSAFMEFDEQPGDNSLARRFSFAQQAARLADVAGMVTNHVQHNVTSETTIGDIHVHTPATDPKAHAAAVRKGIESHPLMSPTAQGTVSLATRGMTG
jgi:hypothetical protein